MEKIPKNKLKLFFTDILNGYSISSYKDKKIYIKHLSSLDAGDIDIKKDEYYQKAVKNRLPTQKEKEEYLIKEKLWAEENDQEIEKIKKYLISLKQSKSKVFKQTDIDFFKNEIKKEEIKLFELNFKKRELIGYTAEDYATKKINEYYMYISIYDHFNLNNLFFKNEEFQELENQDITDLVRTYNKIISNFADNNLKNIALSSYFLALFNVSNDSLYNLYGKPIVHLSFYQIETFTYARYFKNLISSAKHQPPNEYYEDPEKLVEWIESSKNAEEMMQKSNIEKNTEGAIGTSIIGASKEDLQKAGIKNESGISLMAEAAKKGGKLSMQDMLKLHGI